MWQAVFLLLSVLFTAAANAQGNDGRISVADTARTSQIVEASCGQCQFKMEGKGCTLAVRINGKAYFVDGTSIDDHGDAHANDGFCQTIRKASVKGEIIKDRYKVSYFKLLPLDKKPPQRKKDN